MAVPRALKRFISEIRIWISAVCRPGSHAVIVNRFHYQTHGQLRADLADFMAAYNFVRRLETLSGMTPYHDIRKIRTSEPNRFIVDPIHQMPGLNS